mgnify:CR=1 FL=1
MGQFIAIVGRPNSGKTKSAISMAKQIAKGNVLIVTDDDNACKKFSIDTWDFGNPDFNVGELNKVMITHEIETLIYDVSFAIYDTWRLRSWTFGDVNVIKTICLEETNCGLKLGYMKQLYELTDSKFNKVYFC